MSTIPTIVCLKRLLAALAIVVSAIVASAAEHVDKAALSATESGIQGCTVGIIGAGWSGVYWAWRLGIDAAVVPAREICIFEAYGRVGGRTYSVSERSGPDGEVVATIDVGAYRFAGDMHLPGDLITHALRIPSVCYEPSCHDKESLPYWPYKLPLRKVVDEAGHNAGYATPVRRMLEQLEAAGGRLFRGHRLSALDVLPSYDVRRSGSALPLSNRAVALNFSNALTAIVRIAMLNLPRPALLGVAGLTDLIKPRTQQMLRCDSAEIPVMPPPLLHSSGAAKNAREGGAKAYAYYEDAWWVSKLNLTEGHYRDETADPPLAIRYHDGPVECALGVDAGSNDIWGPPALGARCRGALQVVYDFNHVGWWLDKQGRPEEPFTLLRDPALLSEVHRRLMEAHADILAAAGVAPKSVPQPEWIALGTWRTGTDVLQPGPLKVVFRGGDAGLARACAIPHLTFAEYQESVLAPVPPEIWLANNDFHAQPTEVWEGDWAQDSLLLAERVLLRLHVPAPVWLNSTYYQMRIVEMDADSVPLKNGRESDLLV
mmetsp:Transcript_127194/g.283575  ORF Transcript_127194/g.283575 Transcript_127194/m.283575 type:complete len:544 (+) Transcript_127194:62-1693(+)